MLLLVRFMRRCCLYMKARAEPKGALHILKVIMLYIEILESLLSRKKLHACFKSMCFATLFNIMLHELFFLIDVETNTGDKVIMSFIAI